MKTIIQLAQDYHKRKITSMPLSPWEFDQGDQGWRSFTSTQDQINSLHSYINDHVSHLHTWNPYIESNLNPNLLYFHLGQLYVKSGDHKKALEYLPLGFLSNNKSMTDMLWNNFVSAWIYYCQGSLLGLESAYMVADHFNYVEVSNYDCIKKLLTSLKTQQNFFDL